MTNPSGTPSIKEGIKKLYERISVEREGILADIPKLFTDDLHFINPVVDHVGMEDFIATWKRAFGMYKTFECRDIEVIGDETFFKMTYWMNVKMALGPTFRIDMATDCHARDGKVYYCRDYFDPLGTLVGPFPPAAWLYRKIFGLVVV